MLNPDRPSNPFGISDEPDWITVSKSVRNDTSQFISTVSSVASSEPRGRVLGPRKLPPPFEPASASPIDVRSITAAKNAALASSSTSPSPRRTSSSASQNSLSKKPPPVAKKPVHLTASATETNSPSASPKIGSNGRQVSAYFSSPRSMAGVQTEFPPPPRKATEAFNQAPAITQPPPRRSMAGVQTEFPPPPRTATDISMREFAQAPPPPQPRRPAAGSASMREENQKAAPRPPQRQQPAVDLLGDGVGESENAGLKGWEVLKPS
jgi:synaptojanin